MFRKILGMLAVSIALVTTAGVSAAVPAELPQVLPDEFLDTTETACHVTNAVCATSIAVSSVVCTRPAFRTVQCTGASTFGGHGVSPLKLPGSVSWSGSGRCSDECTSPTTTSGSGGASWGGLLGANGAGSQQTKNYGTKLKFSLFRTCIKYTVDTDADATARATLVVTLVTVDAPHAHHRVTNSLCNF